MLLTISVRVHYRNHLILACDGSTVYLHTHSHNHKLETPPLFSSASSDPDLAAEFK